MQTDQSDANQSAVLQVTRQLTQLMIDRNTIEIDKLLDSDFTLTHMTGYVQSKKEWLNEISNERMKYYSCKEVSKLVKTNGDKASFVGQDLIDARIWGSRHTWRLQQTMRLEKLNGQWIIMDSVATTF